MSDQMNSDTARRRSVLIAFASRHGATEDIARRISSRLIDQLPSDEWRVDVLEAATVEDFVGYDAVVLGSAIYLGRWLRPAVSLLRRSLTEPPLGLWAFSSGLVDDSVSPTHVEPAVAGIPVRNSAVFGGCIDRDKLNPFERVVTGLIRVKDGDFRDWEAIDAWAGSIAQSLLTDLSTSTHNPVQHTLEES